MLLILYLLHFSLNTCTTTNNQKHNKYNSEGFILCFCLSPLILFFHMFFFTIYKETYQGFLWQEPKRIWALDPFQIMKLWTKHREQSIYSLKLQSIFPPLIFLHLKWIHFVISKTFNSVENTIIFYIYHFLGTMGIQNIIANSQNH